MAPVAWILGAFLLAWPLFLFFSPQTKDEKGALPPFKVRPPSKLNAVGLADNVDWEDMPGFFAVWADKLEWKNDKTQFAYWNPGSNSYSYFFEASRAGGGTRFRSISKREALAERQFMVVDGAYAPTDGDATRADIGNVRFTARTEEHPFLFFPEIKSQLILKADLPEPAPRSAPNPMQVQLEQTPLSLKNAPKPDEPGKK